MIYLNRRIWDLPTSDRNTSVIFLKNINLIHYQHADFMILSYNPLVPCHGRMQKNLNSTSNFAWNPTGFYGLFIYRKIHTNPWFSTIFGSVNVMQMAICAEYRPVLWKVQKSINSRYISWTFNFLSILTYFVRLTYIKHIYYNDYSRKWYNCSCGLIILLCSD